MRLRNVILSLVIVLIVGVLVACDGEGLPKDAAEPTSLLITSEQRESVERAISWLVASAQNDDGGYASFGGSASESPSTIAGTLDATLAIAAAGRDPAVPFPGESNTPIGYLLANGAELKAFADQDGGQAGKVLLALTASAAEPSDFAGHDFVESLMAQLEPSGAFGVTDPFKQSVAILGLAADGRTVPTTAIDWLVGLQAANGSWDDGFGTIDNPDATAMAVMALIASGRTADDSAITAAVDFLAEAQNADGGWGYAAGLPTSANSTSLVIQALSALGENWYSTDGQWAQGDHMPLLALLSFQSARGAFQADVGQGPVDDIYATVQAIPAMANRPFPLPAFSPSGQ